MDLVEAISQIIKASLDATNLAERVAAIFRTVMHRRKERGDEEARPISIYDIDPEKLAVRAFEEAQDQKRNFTYADLCENIVVMVYIREEIVMRIEIALMKQHPSQEEITSACRNIYEVVTQLRMLVRDLYWIIHRIEGDEYLKLGGDIHRMMAATNVATDFIIEKLGYDYKADTNNTDLFFNPESREQMLRLCGAMKHMASYLRSRYID